MNKAGHMMRKMTKDRNHPEQRMQCHQQAVFMSSAKKKPWDTDMWGLQRRGQLLRKFTKDRDQPGHKGPPRTKVERVQCHQQALAPSCAKETAENRASPPRSNRRVCAFQKLAVDIYFSMSISLSTIQHSLIGGHCFFQSQNNNKSKEHGKRSRVLDPVLFGGFPRMLSVTCLFCKLIL